MALRSTGEILLSCGLLFALTLPAGAQSSDSLPPIHPVVDLEVRDRPLDAGNSLEIGFGRSIDDPMGKGRVATYELLRKGPDETDFTSIKTFRANLRDERMSYEDDGLRVGKEYLYLVRVTAIDGEQADGAVVGPVKPERQYIFTNKLNTLIATIIFVALIMGFVRIARGGKKLFIRRIAGLDAIDEAVGRCTEMGKPTLYIPGISSIEDVATIASLNILGQVAKKIASYQSRIIVPNRDPIVYPITQDVVKLAFAEAGYPNNYCDDDIYFVTNDQFAYAAAVCGTMVREKPGANLLLGMFYAESLVLAETGASIGAIQIAGTDSITQLPFFVTACDYTIIGEELYAASAYISHEPTLLGSLKGQDYFKLLLIILVLVGALSMTIGILMSGEPFDWVTEILRVRSA